jgi:hypothetical protein
MLQDYPSEAVLGIARFDELDYLSADLLVVVVTDDHILLSRFCSGWDLDDGVQLPPDSLQAERRRPRMPGFDCQPDQWRG